MKTAQLSELADRQHGIVTASQAARAGLTRSAIAAHLCSGRWQRLYRGVYATFSGKPDRLATLWAAVLYAGAGALLSHETAAELAGLTDRPSKLIHITIPAQRRVTPMQGIVIHRSAAAGRARDPRKVPPQTTIHDTVIDLAAAAATLDDAASWILRVLQRGLTARIYLAHALAQRAKMPWRTELTELITLDTDGLHSVLELRYHRDIAQPHHLPPATRQAQARNAGRTIYRDLLYDPYHTAVELDGDTYHPADTRWRDIHRDNAAAADGITTLRYGWTDITTRPCQVAAQIATILATRGYTSARPCSPGCPLGQLGQTQPKPTTRPARPPRPRPDMPPRPRPGPGAGPARTASTAPRVQLSRQR
jgi:hypothetical protein